MKLRNTSGIFLTSCILVVLCAAVAAALSFPGLGKSEKVKASNGVVTIPVAKLADGKAHFFTFSEAGKEITFFLVKAADGSIKTAFNACDACYREKKGYEQKGTMMLCRNCNMKFAINKLGPNATGGCNPSYLPHTQTGSNIVVSVNDLKAGARFF